MRLIDHHFFREERALDQRLDIQVERLVNQSLLPCKVVRDIDPPDHRRPMGNGVFRVRFQCMAEGMPIVQHAAQI